MTPAISDQRSAISKSRAGLTMVELLVAVALVAFIGLVVLATVITGNRSMAANQARISATQEARRGLEEMSRELVRAPVAEITDESGANAWPPAGGSWSSVRFRYPEGVDASGTVNDWSDYIVYTFDAAEQQLVRREGVDTRIVANGVTAFTVVPGETDDEIWIELTTQRTSPVNDQVMQQPLSVRLRVRNE